MYDPWPIVMLKRFLDNMREGDILEMISDDPAAESDMKAWSKLTGHKLIDICYRQTESVFCIQKKSWS